MASDHRGGSDWRRGPRLSRRALLKGAAGGLVGLLGGDLAWDAVEAHRPVAAGSAFGLIAAAGLPLLLDPNKGDQLDVVLPLASQGGVPSTVLLPIAGSSPGTAVAGPGWVRTLRFRQPYSGQAVDPNLAGVAGRLPRWGLGGAGSADVLVVRSRDGWAWSADRAFRQPRTRARSVLADAPGSPAGSIDPMALPDPILVWAAADMDRSLARTTRLMPHIDKTDSFPGARHGSTGPRALQETQPAAWVMSDSAILPQPAAVAVGGVTLYPGQRVGTDFSGSGNELLVNPGAAVMVHGPEGGSRKQQASSVALTAGSSGLGCAFAGGPAAAWTALVGLLPGDHPTAATTGPQPVFALRPVAAGPAAAPRAGPANVTPGGGDQDDPPGDRPAQSLAIWTGPVNFLPGGGPTVVAATSGGTTLSALATAGGTVIQSTIRVAPLSPHATASKPFGGIDLTSGDRLFAVVVWAAALSRQEMEAAAKRIAYAGRLTPSEDRA